MSLALGRENWAKATMPRATGDAQTAAMSLVTFLALRDQLGTCLSQPACTIRHLVILSPHQWMSIPYAIWTNQ